MPVKARRRRVDLKTLVKHAKPETISLSDRVSLQPPRGLFWTWWSCVSCHRSNYTIHSQADFCPHNALCQFQSGERNICKEGCWVNGRGYCALRILRRRKPAWAT